MLGVLYRIVARCQGIVDIITTLAQAGLKSCSWLDLFFFCFLSFGLVLGTSDFTVGGLEASLRTCGGTVGCGVGWLGLSFVWQSMI